jgi:putative IMPACT (imprinted ancient) family translation regulator
MSKNKNPLKDLDLFLKQQASSFVNPTPLSEKIQEEPTDAEHVVSSGTTQEDLIQTLSMMMDKNPSALYDLLIKAAEQKSGAERTVLINTALYLKNTNSWKEAIQEYWKNSPFKIQE